MKYLIVGLGNIGPEYQDTRHNIGFNVLDAFAKASNAVFEDMRYGAVCEMKLKGRTLVLLKPNTYMNLSGSCQLLDAKRKDRSGRFVGYCRRPGLTFREDAFKSTRK